jgi:hypothetical protein
MRVPVLKLMGGAGMHFAVALPKQENALIGDLAVGSHEILLTRAIFDAPPPAHATLCSAQGTFERVAATFELAGGALPFTDCSGVVAQLIQRVGGRLAVPRAGATLGLATLQSVVSDLSTAAAAMASAAGANAADASASDPSQAGQRCPTGLTRRIAQHPGHPLLVLAAQVRGSCREVICRLRDLAHIAGIDRAAELPDQTRVRSRWPPARRKPDRRQRSSDASVLQGSWSALGPHPVHCCARRLCARLC